MEHLSEITWLQREIQCILASIRDIGIYRIDEQRRRRRDCAYAQSCPSRRFLRTKGIYLDQIRGH